MSFGAVAAIIGIGAMAYTALNKPKTPPPPAPVATPLAPTMDSTTILNSQQRAAAAQQARGGRASTILSTNTSPTDNGKLGG